MPKFLMLLLAILLISPHAVASKISFDDMYCHVSNAFCFLYPAETTTIVDVNNYKEAVQSLPKPAQISINQVTNNNNKNWPQNAVMLFGSEPKMFKMVINDISASLLSKQQNLHEYMQDYMSKLPLKGDRAVAEVEKKYITEEQVGYLAIRKTDMQGEPRHIYNYYFVAHNGKSYTVSFISHLDAAGKQAKVVLDMIMSTLKVEE